MAEQPDGKGKKERKAINVGKGIRLSAVLRDNGTLCTTLPECDVVLFTAGQYIPHLRMPTCPSSFCE